MKYCFLLLLNFCLISLHAQNSTTVPCAAPGASQFDFWIGSWTATWSDTLHGTNTIEKKFGNCTVHENFFDPNNNYHGESWSVYNPSAKQWNQTWIDNKGGYIALTGAMEDGKMILKTGEKQTPKGKQQMRMVYYNIQADSFDWSWEGSTDGGLTWKPSWQIHYTRKK
ncbi:MAG TPA: hypothetical protein VJ499_11035 [Flavisolibacter sp.]|nr:hypothetical protein [Flavisolibacter sp.]